MENMLLLSDWVDKFYNMGQIFTATYFNMVYEFRKCYVPETLLHEYSPF